MKFWDIRAPNDDKALSAAIDRSLAVITFDLDGNVLSANANFLAAMGYQIGQVAGQHHSKFMPGDEAHSAAYKSFWADLRKGTFKSGEFRRVANGGRELWLRATYNPVLDWSGKPIRVVKIAADITQEKQRSLDEAGQIAAINRSQAVISFDLNGIILDANTNFLDTVGYKRDEIVGQYHRMFVAPEESASAAYQAFWEALRRGEYQAAEYCRRGKGGREIWIRATYNPIFGSDGRPMKVVKFAVDVTAEKLRNADYESQVAAIKRTQAVISFTLDGTILDANENFLKATGYCIDEIKGQHHRMFVDTNYGQSGEYREFWQKLGEGSPVSAIYQRFGKGGRQIWLQATYNPILDAAGKPWKVVKYASDITTSMVTRKRAVTAADKTLGNVESVARAADTMNSSMVDIVSSMNRSKDAVGEINAQTAAVDRSTTKMHEAAQAMNGIVQLIAKVANETNMLALNATIESARAGEAGRGFAVVAQEVKSLAAQTGKATSRISDEISAMQSVVGEVVETIASITAAIREVQSMVDVATTAINSQSTTTTDIFNRMNDAADDVASIGRTLDEWVVGVEERRTDRRVRVVKAAIIHPQGGASIECSLRNISRTGARLVLDQTDGIPSRFQLEIEGEGGRRWCEVMRREPNELGVKFSAAMAA